MKMVRKILLGLVATAAVISFVGCAQAAEDEEKAFNGDKISFTHDGESGNYYRSFKSTKTKHNSANAKIILENPTEINVSGHVSNAGLGFVFGLKDVTDKDNPVKVTNKEGKEETVTFYSFGIASVRYCSKTEGGNTKGVQWYVSWCENVPDTVFNYNNSDAFKDEIKGTEYGKETEVLKGTNSAWKTVSGLTLTDDKKLNAIIKTVANTDGSYKVSLCDSEGKEIDSTTINNTVTKLTEKTQLLIGRYLTVYSGETVKGSIEYSDVNGNIIPADYVED